MSAGGQTTLAIRDGDRNELEDLYWGGFKYRYIEDPATWGAGLPGLPVVIGDKNTQYRLNVFLIPVAKWSDGTADHTEVH